MMDAEQPFLPLAGLVELNLDEHNVRSIYEPLLDRCARLLAFGQSTPRKVYWPVIDRQDALAVDDLIIFALHARRFMHTTYLVALAHNVFIPISIDLRRSRLPVSVWRALTTIIHNDDITLVRELDFIEALHKLRDRMSSLSDFLRNETAAASLPAKIIVTSDQMFIAFDLYALVSVFVNRIIGAAVQICSQHGIDLTGQEREVDKFIEAVEGVLAAQTEWWRRRR